MAGDDDTTLSAEEVQIVRTLTAGGFGVFPIRAYRQVLNLILPRVSFALRDMGPRSRRGGRPSAADEHRRRHARVRLIRGVAFAALETLAEQKADDRKARRRQQRRDRAVIRAAERAGRHEVADWLSVQAAFQQREDEARRDEHRRRIDELTLNLRQLVERHSRLRGERRNRMIGDILVALQLAGSSEPAAIEQRFRRMPPELKAAAKKAAKPTT